MGLFSSKPKLELRAGEVLIRDEVVAVRRKVLIGVKPDQGRLYVINQRVVFPGGIESFSYELDEIRCFENGMMGVTTIVTKQGTQHKFTTSSAKKVKRWLREAGIAEQEK